MVLCASTAAQAAAAPGPQLRWRWPGMEQSGPATARSCSHGKMRRMSKSEKTAGSGKEREEWESREVGGRVSQGEKEVGRIIII